MMQASFSGRTLLSAVPDLQPRVTRHAKLPSCLGLQTQSQRSAVLSSQPSSFSVHKNLLQGAVGRHSSYLVRAVGEQGEDGPKMNKEFGYSRKDVILIGVGIFALGYGLYYGAQAAGIEATTAGNYVQLFIFVGICLGYISTYIFRVANKDMTYAKQLDAYEERVMQKRLEEMPETERERLMEEVAAEQKRKAEQGGR